jgi:hypothetical protein
MSVTSVQIVDRERYIGQIEKLVHSHTLRKAESLCKLLRYLAEHELSRPGTSAKEYQIATEVFGRPDDFDPQADSAVRVQAGRLRLKLLDYYSHEGAGDSLVVEVPNGSYALRFHDREPLAVQPKGAVAIPPVPQVGALHQVTSPLANSPATRTHKQRWVVTVGALSLGLAFAVTAIVLLMLALNSARADKLNGVTASGGIRALWSPFAANPDVPWVIFSNAAFVGRPETGMRYLDPGRDSRRLILDHYTGVGEVLAIHDLDTVFSSLNHPIRVKRGSLFSLDDANATDLIFVGSPAENLTLLDLPGTREFIFTRPTSEPHKGELAIRNVHPEPGQPSLFFASDSSQPLEEDYAIVALLPGLNPARHVMILAGTTTIGTQAAVEFVCEEGSVRELLQKLSIHDRQAKPFEALLRVKVTRGVPVGIQLVAVRRRN